MGAPKDLDVGHPEPTDPLNAGHLKMLVGQHRRKLGRRRRALATTYHLSQWMPARNVAEDVRKHQHPGRAQHSGDLGHSNRQICPVTQRHGGEHQIKPGVGEGQMLGSTLHIPDPQPAGSHRHGGGHHLSGQIDPDQLGGWIAGSRGAEEPAGATANIQHRAGLGQDPPAKEQACLVHRNEQELLEHAVLIGAGPEVEPSHGRSSVAHESAFMDGGRWAAAGGL